MIPPPNQSHIHGPNCSHSHQHRPQRDFIPMQIPRVFWVFSCLNGQFFQRMFLQLPLMIQFYQIYLMMKGMVCQQPKDFYFQGVSSCLHNVPYALLRQILGGFSIPFLLINYFGITYVFQYQIPDLDSKYTVDFLLKCSLVSTFILYVAFFLVDPGFLNTKEDKAEMQEIVQKRPEIAHPRNFCAFCSQPRIARF